jgi:hypothetical protein
LANHSLYSSREWSLVRKIKALRPYNPGIHRDFSLSYAPFENARKIKMLEASLSQLEQLSLMEQEEKQGATVARIQALVERVSAGPVGA